MKIALRILSLFVLGLTSATLHAAGSLKVTLTPGAANTAGAQWRVDSGAWKASGATVKGLSPGNHNVEFKTVPGWIAPAPRVVNVPNVQGIIEASDGALYGTTSSGGANSSGAVFRVNKDGSGYTVVRSFVGGAADGKFPYSGVIEAGNGKLYGTTLDGGSATRGTIYSLNKDGTGYTVLRQFAGGTADGALPYAAVIQGSDGLIYGTTTEGGNYGFGTVYRLSVDGTGYSILKHFTGGATDGVNPYYAGVVEQGGVLYGTTAGGGAFNKGILFALNRDGTGYRIVINFGAGISDAAVPLVSLAKATDGALYGTTGYGAGGGTVFRLRTN